jgi:hypothetical protein
VNHLVHSLADRTTSAVTISSAMPFKSQAQRRKFAQLLVEGKISNQTFEEWNRETGGKKLPERANKRAPARRKKKTAAQRTGTKKRRP